MAINRDFRDLFAALNESGARYLLVGGYAVALHAQPRFTKDLDLWIGSDSANAIRVYEALRSFGAPLMNVTSRDLAEPGVVLQIGVAPNRVDLMTSIDGVAFEEAWEARGATRYADQEINVIGRAHLIQNKRASGRPQDLIDLQALERQGTE
jgi:hypothetical protein